MRIKELNSFLFYSPDETRSPFYSIVSFDRENEIDRIIAEEIWTPDVHICD